MAAAIGGMLVPALIYAAANPSGPSSNGWGVPMATDIAFALGVLAVVGKGLPSQVRVFLLSLAIVDDVGSIVVIAVFYSRSLRPIWFLVAAAFVVVIYGGYHLKGQQLWIVAVGAAGLWLSLFQAGIHPTIAGVICGLMTPAVEDAHGHSTAEHLLHRFHPWSSFVIAPVFAVAAAGVTITAEGLRSAATDPVAIGVFLGLVVGKPLGILAGAGLSSKLGLGDAPRGAHVATAHRRRRAGRHRVHGVVPHQRAGLRARRSPQRVRSSRSWRPPSRRSSWAPPSCSGPVAVGRRRRLRRSGRAPGGRPVGGAPRRGRRRSAGCAGRRTCAASGKSSDTPPPPWAWMARSTTRSAMFGATTLMAEISIAAPLLPTVSISHAALSVSSRACSISMRESAIHSWITPCSASGLPNATRLDDPAAHQLERPLGHRRRSACSGGCGRGRGGPGRWRSRRPPRRSGWSTGTRTSSKQQLAVALAVLVAEHRQGPDDRSTPGRVAGHEDHRLLEVARRVGVGLAHDDEDLAAVATPRPRSTTCGR